MYRLSYVRNSSQNTSGNDSGFFHLPLARLSLYSANEILCMLCVITDHPSVYFRVDNGVD